MGFFSTQKNIHQIVAANKAAGDDWFDSKAMKAGDHHVIATSKNLYVASQLIEPGTYDLIQWEVGKVLKNGHIEDVGDKLYIPGSSSATDVKRHVVEMERK